MRVSGLRARLVCLALGVVLAGGVAAKPVAASAASHRHLIVVSIRHQHLWAYDSGRLFVSTDVTTGRPALPTPTGDYHIFYKRSPLQFVSPWPPSSPYYYAPVWTRYGMEFIHGGYFLHDAPWRHWYGPGSNVGAGTHGCVNIPLWAMQRLYYWANIGDEVVVTAA